MKYYYEPKMLYSHPHYAITYVCDHPAYSRCSLYDINGDGLAVIQQRFDPETKHTYWTEIDPELIDDLYLKKGFYDYFLKVAGPATDGLYPTVTVRQLMWALRLKPLKREPWETVFDKSPI